MVAVHEFLNDRENVLGMNSDLSLHMILIQKSKVKKWVQFPIQTLRQSPKTAFPTDKNKGIVHF
jgi:hypothetical protein